MKCEDRYLVDKFSGLVCTYCHVIFSQHGTSTEMRVWIGGQPRAVRNLTSLVNIPSGILVIRTRVATKSPGQNSMTFL